MACALLFAGQPHHLGPALDEPIVGQRLRRAPRQRCAIERVQERRAFGRHIGDFGMIKDKIATMLAQLYALESMTYLTAAMVDAKTDYSIESAICQK